VRVITYFSLYSVNDQCQGFTILTDGRGLQGGLPLRHHNRDTDRTLLRRRVRTVLVPRCAHGRHQADPDGRVRCPRVQHGRHVRRRGILCRHEWVRYNLYILTIITYIYIHTLEASPRVLPALHSATSIRRRKYLRDVKYKSVCEEGVISQCETFHVSVCTCESLH
jgi:hypothetical protein